MGVICYRSVSRASQALVVNSPGSNMNRYACETLIYV